jgi:hypothetical protein
MPKAVLTVRIPHELLDQIDQMAVSQAREASDQTHRVVEPSRSATALGILLRGLTALEADTKHI